MGFVSSASTLIISAYLTHRGRELYLLGDDNDILTKYFSLGDSDANYYTSASEIINTDDKNLLTNGFIPDLTGALDSCLKPIASGIEPKYLINYSKNKEGDIINQYCQPPYTLVQEISNGDGTSYIRTFQNSLSCGFFYRSNEMSRSFTKTGCLSGGTGQSYTVLLSYGQFTGTTQQIADQNAINYLNVSGQTIANQNGSCSYGNQIQTMNFVRNNCQYGGNSYQVTASANTFFSTINVNDANQKAIIYLNTNGQAIANQNGTCKTIIGYQSVPVLSYVSPNAPGRNYSEYYVHQGSITSQYPTMFDTYSFDPTRSPQPRLSAYINPIELGNNTRRIPATFDASLPAPNSLMNNTDMYEVKLTVIMGYDDPNGASNQLVPDNWININTSSYQTSIFNSPTAANTMSLVMSKTADSIVTPFENGFKTRSVTFTSNQFVNTLNIGERIRFRSPFNVDIMYYPNTQNIYTRLDYYYTLEINRKIPIIG